jgi:hypothetical protein
MRDAAWSVVVFPSTTHQPEPRMRTTLLALAVTSLAMTGNALLAPEALAQGGRMSIGPLVGSAPGADVSAGRVPTVGVVGDVGLLRVGTLGLHLVGTMEHRAGARMTGVVAGLRVPVVHRRFALRLGAAMGGAEVRRFDWDQQLGWRDWRGVDAGLEMRLGRTTGALMVRGGTIDQYVSGGCAPNANCIAIDAPPAERRRFVRVSFESRYSLF